MSFDFADTPPAVDTRNSLPNNPDFHTRRLVPKIFGDGEVSLMKGYR
ncbi:12243_t:CDS:2 [Funneliformis mosseae]|uniref:12243_t:CDS:1 n=1 Tax=Funneliformis mosseae TaxID=27381 RepID=A0A9N9H0X4_FUNMO|nr:12243_t:CDS:2 [Funneliformis mosseae]